MFTIARAALITGASGAIGSAAARQLAADGYGIVIAYNTNEQAATLLRDELARVTDVICCRADVSDENQLNQLFKNATDSFGGVSVLVNNAGIALQKLFADTTAQDFGRIVSVNLEGAASCCRRAIPYMVKQQSGKIINISSMWGVAGASCEAAYSASKAGLIGLTKALARELAPSNIQVNCIAPGVIDTPMNHNLSPADREALREEIPMRRFGEPEEVAALISFLASSKSDYITAQVIGIDGGFI